MKKNKIKFLKLLTFLFILSLFGCSEDLYETENNKSNYKVSFVNSVAIQKNKELLKILREKKIIRTNSLNKIVIDTVNYFSIDTDFVKFMQGPDFNSYTFKIIEQEENYLDNLVLVSKLGAPYTAFVMRYNLSDEEKIALNTGTAINFTNKAKVLKLSNFNITNDVLGKLIYQEECNWVSTWEEVVTLSIDPDECDCYGLNNTSVSHVLVGSLVCSGNGGGSELGDVGTSPHGGGGSGSGDQLQQTPCETLNEAIQNPKVNQGIQNLKAKTLHKNESAYEITRKFDLNLDTYIYNTKLIYGDNFTAPVQIGGFIKGQAHNHPIDGQSIPSIGDVYWTMQCQTEINPSNSIGYNIAVCPNPASPTQPNTAIIYAITVDNLETLTNQINNIYGANFDSLTIEKQNKLKDKMNYRYAEKFANLQNSTLGMEKKFLEIYANFGISLYKFDINTNNWEKLNLTNNIVTPQPCE